MDEPEKRAQVTDLVVRAINPSLDDEELSRILEELSRVVPHPDVGALIFLHEPELTVEEIVDMSLSYVPAALPGSAP